MESTFAVKCPRRIVATWRDTHAGTSNAVFILYEKIQKLLCSPVCSKRCSRESQCGVIEPFIIRRSDTQFGVRISRTFRRSWWIIPPICRLSTRRCRYPGIIQSNLKPAICQLNRCGSPNGSKRSILSWEAAPAANIINKISRTALMFFCVWNVAFHKSISNYQRDQKSENISMVGRVFRMLTAVKSKFSKTAVIGPGCCNSAVAASGVKLMEP